MQFRWRRWLLALLLGLFVVAFAFAVSMHIAEPASEFWKVIYLNAPLFLLCFICIFGSLVAYRFLSRRWAICFVGGTMLGVSPLLLGLVNLVIFLVFGENSALIDFVLYRYLEWLYEPGAMILESIGLQFDIYSSHISQSWLLISWVVYTLLAMLIWTMVLAVALRAFDYLRRRFSRRYR